jgi:predicted nucleic acid-binding protein
MTSPILVLDTNICLDLFVFHDPRWSVILTGLQNGRLKAVTNQGCRNEWLAVLQYKHLPVTDANRAGMIDAFDRLISWSDHPLSPNIKLPLCNDPDDQQFMELARDSGATHLLTKDKALLKCAKKIRRLGLFQIMLPEAFLEFLSPQ